MADISEEQFAAAVDSRSRAPIYEYMKAARVGIAGLGGLGSHIAAALARSGVGHLTIVDYDAVELSNIGRQLYTAEHIGRHKCEALGEIIRRINPFCEVEAHFLRLDENNCAQIFADCEIICEAFDTAECKAMLVEEIMEKFPDKQLVCGSGMAGYGRANEIVTRRIGKNLTICGDGSSDVADGEGLTASRVMICAGHQASRVIEIILEKRNNNGR